MGKPIFTFFFFHYKVCSLACSSCSLPELTIDSKCLIRLVFTSDGVIVGAVIRSVYDPVKIKPTESEAEHRFIYDSVAYDLMKTGLSESEAKADE